MWEAIDKETVPPAALALQKQQQGGFLVVSGGCSLLNKAADWARSLPSTPDWLHPYGKDTTARAKAALNISISPL